jgi:hypothetical protein
LRFRLRMRLVRFACDVSPTKRHFRLQIDDCRLAESKGQAEVEAEVEAETRYEPDPDAPPLPDDED